MYWQRDIIRNISSPIQLIFITPIKHILQNDTFRDTQQNSRRADTGKVVNGLKEVPWNLKRRTAINYFY